MGWRRHLPRASRARVRAARGSTRRSLRTSRQELADGSAKASALQEAWPGTEKSRGGAPGGARLRSQGGAARLASVPGWFRRPPPGASQVPAFLGAPLPSACEGRCGIDQLLREASPAEAAGFCRILSSHCSDIVFRRAPHSANFLKTANRTLSSACYQSSRGTAEYGVWAWR